MLPHASPNHPPWFDYPNNNLWKVQLIKLLIMKYSLSTCHVPSFRYKYYSQHFVFRHYWVAPTVKITHMEWIPIKWNNPVSSRIEICMAYLHVCMYICVLYVCMYVCMYVRMYVCMYVCICVYVFMYACVYARMCIVFIYMYVFKYILTCLYVYTYAYVFMSLCSNNILTNLATSIHVTMKCIPLQATSPLHSLCYSSFYFINCWDRIRTTAI
jgi:hypothetical protein